MRISMIMISVLVLLASQSALGLTTIEVSLSHRLIAAGTAPDEGFAEGGFEATFTGEAPINPVNSAPPLVQVDDRTWVYTFLWNDVAPVTIAFVDLVGDTTSVEAVPASPMPLDIDVHVIPLIHIETALENLWDPETGIFVWGEHDNCLQSGELWERPATFTYFHDGLVEIEEPIGLRLNGHSSRAGEQKSWRVYFDDFGTQDFIDHDLFGSDPTIFQRLILRTGRWPSNIIYANFGETLYRDLGHMASRYSPIAVYLNNECWGIYSLRERFDDEFIEETYGITGDYTLVKDNVAVTGDIMDWYDFQDSFFDVDDCNSHAWFESVGQRLDIQSYIDWLFINIFGATTDNGYAWNVATLKVGNEPWQILMWDEDGLLRDANLDANHFLLYTAENEAEFQDALPPEFSHPWWSFDINRWNTLFRTLMQNSEFKAMFTQRIEELLAGQMSVSAMHDRLDGLRDGIMPELPFHSERWLYFSFSSFNGTLDAAKDFVAHRHEVVPVMYADFLESFRIPVELSEFSAVPGPDRANLTWRTESEEDNAGFQVYRSVGTPDQMVLLASYTDMPSLVGAGTTGEPTAYQFVDDDAPVSTPLFYQLHHVSTGGLATTVNWIEQASLNDYQGLVINEFLARNSTVNQDEMGEFEDWVEIYNPGPSSIAMGGLHLTDDLLQPTQWVFPDTTLEAGGHLLVWCDDDPEDGPLHTTFKLSGSGEEIGLFSSLASGTELIDSFSFGAQEDDVSEGRRTDGSLEWFFFNHPTPGQSNDLAISVPEAPMAHLRLLPAAPNPFNPATTLRFEIPSSGRARLRIFDTRGRLVANLIDESLAAGFHEVKWHGRDDSGRSMASGVYFGRLDFGHLVETNRLVLVQ